MQASKRAAKAYEAATSQRSWREQEADIFRRTSGVLREAVQASRLQKVRALADNRRLWMAVTDLVLDTNNKLPEPLRAGIASLGRSVQREMDLPSPNFEFLATVNDHLAAGLATTPAAPPTGLG